MPQLDISGFGAQIFWLIVIFGILYIVISKFLAPKAENIFSSRDQYLTQNYLLAEKYKNSATSLFAEKELKLQELRGQIEIIKKNAEQDLENSFLRKNNELLDLITKKRDEAITEITQYTRDFQAQKDGACIDLAAFIIQRITNRKPNTELLEKIYRAK